MYSILHVDTLALRPCGGPEGRAIPGSSHPDGRMTHPWTPHSIS